MQPIKEIRGAGLPLRRSDVDTDQIIPSEWLKRVERTGFGKGLFSEWKEDPAFVLNNPAYDQAKILVAGPNFGTGSSREHAVWALTDYGFQAVVSSRFGDIFRNNSTKAGLVPIVVDQEVVDSISAQIEKDPGTEIVIDIASRTISVASLALVATFPLDDFTQYRLIEGLDDIGLTLRSAQDIEDFEAQRPHWLPSLEIA